MEFMTNLLVLIISLNLVNGVLFQIPSKKVIYESVAKLNLSLKCSEHYEAFWANLQSTKNNKWALKMLDATSKLQSGILIGNLGELGSFEECIGVKTETAVGQISGKYCLGRLSLMKPLEVATSAKYEDFYRLKLFDNNAQGSKLSLDWSVCFPSGCKAAEVSGIFNYLSENYLNELLSFNFGESNCQTRNEAYPELSFEATIAIIIFSTILVLMFMSTVYDFYLQQVGCEAPNNILIAFSILTNGQKLFKISTNIPEQIPCLNGLRVISMMWIILGHQFSSASNGFVFNRLNAMEWLNSTYSMYVLGSSLAVDTFFVLSGLLMVYGFLKAKSKEVPFNVLLYWLHRYLRLTPALAAIVLVHAALTEYIGNGPLMPMMKKHFVNNCRNYWWSTLLYVQNYVNVKEMCVGETWYLSVDMQLFILSPLILIPLWRWKKYGLISLCLLILASIAVPLGIAWENNLLSMFNPAENRNYMEMYYYLTHTRAAPWLIGILLGHYIFIVQKHKTPIKLNRMLIIFMWTASISVLITCVFGGHSTLRGEEYNKWEHVSHITFVRPAWAIALSWIIFACITGNGGPINWFLSLPIYQVLGRLTYSAYLLHSTVLYMRIVNSRVPFYFTDGENLYLFWGAAIFATALAVVWILAFESPMLVIEKVIFHQKKRRGQI